MVTFEGLFAPAGLTPHGFCLTWAPGLLWLHAGSDAVTCLSYLSIPLALLQLSRRRSDLAPRWIVNLFIGFILACGIAHGLSILTLWVPAYALEGWAKFTTALLSLTTAIALWPLVPALAALPSRQVIEALNCDLQQRIAAQDAAAAELREQKTWLLLAQEAGQIGSWGIDLRQGQIMQWSATQFALYGVAAACGSETGNMERAAWRELIDPADRDAVDAALHAALASEADYEAEFRIRFADGSIRWLSERGRVVSTARERHGRMVGISVDVTERRRLTEQLAARNQHLSDRADAAAYARQLADEQLRVLFEHSPDALYVLRIERPAGSEDAHDAEFVVEAMNPATERLSGRPPGDFIGLRPQDVYPPEISEKLIAAYRRCLTSDGVTIVATPRLVHGRLREFETALAPVRDPRSGRVSRMIGVARDVTERAELERHLRHVAKMEATNRLTGGIAHEFNNILQSLMGGLEMVLAEVAALSSREYAEIALQAARRGAALTHRLLAFSRQQALQPRPVECGELLAGLRVLLAPSLGPRITLVLEPPSAPLLTLADPGQLEAAIVSLAVNAADAMPEGGRIDISAVLATHVAGLDLAPGPYVVLTVSDTGHGMEPVVLQQACEPFFTTKSGHASGLGLSMVQGFARQSGGDLCLDSAPGQGTSAQLWLPLAQPPNREPAHVLLVDDAADVLVTAGAFLRHAGFAVTRVSSGCQAIAHLSNGAPCDAIVTDYAMPDLNGIDLLREVRDMRPGLPGLIITGFDRTAMHAGTVDARVLQKPFARCDLIEEVRALLEPERAPAVREGAVKTIA